MIIIIIIGALIIGLLFVINFYDVEYSDIKNYKTAHKRKNIYKNIFIVIYLIVLLFAIIVIRKCLYYNNFNKELFLFNYEFEKYEGKQTGSNVYQIFNSIEYDARIYKENLKLLRSSESPYNDVLIKSNSFYYFSVYYLNSKENKEIMFKYDGRGDSDEDIDNYIAKLKEIYRGIDESHNYFIGIGYDESGKANKIFIGYSKKDLKELKKEYNQ